MWIWLCEGTLKAEMAHLRLPVHVSKRHVRKLRYNRIILVYTSDSRYVITRLCLLCYIWIYTESCPIQNCGRCQIIKYVCGFP